MLALLLACAAPERTSCVDADAPPGDPVYLSCLFRATSHSDTAYTRTDAEGRVVTIDTLEGASWSWTRDDEDGCEVRVEERCVNADGDSCGLEVTIRTCDDAGNATSVAVERDGETTTTETAYRYDPEGRPIVETYTVDGEPAGTRTCTYADFDGPDACVYDPPGDPAGDPPSDEPWYATWTRDEDGLPLRYTLTCRNPGYSEWQEWIRDEQGRTTTWEQYDTALSTTHQVTYVYGNAALESLTTQSFGPFSGGPFTTTYLYTPL